MTDSHIDQAVKDIYNGCLTLEGVHGLIDNFSCYVVTDGRYNPDTRDVKAIYKWCEENIGEHKVKFLYIPQGIIEKDHDFWLLASKKHATLFGLRWQIKEQRP